MKKRILCLAIAVMMVAGTSMTASAEDYKGSKSWLANLTGEKIESNFKTSEFTHEILQILPGDSIELEVAIQNSSEDQADWYMTNKVLQTLEDSQESAQGGVYTYILTYRDSEGTVTEFYNSETVGAENCGNALIGLHQATESLEDYFFLDRLDQGEKGTVNLIVKLDGETQGNGYQNTLARLAMNFAVEKVNGPVVIQTGDMTNQLLLFSGIALASGVLLFVLAAYRLKLRRYKKGE